MTDRLTRFRANKDAYFTDGDNSPVEPEALAGFSGLDYFEENPELAFELEIDETAPGAGETITLQTSDDQRVDFLRIGRIAFPLAGREVSLSVYRDLDRGRYFIPFTDATTGASTYELGRYLDPQMNRDGLLLVDFNYAYNPYCAYGDGWSCPIPPEENRVEGAVEAGERAYTPTQPPS